MTLTAAPDMRPAPVEPTTPIKPSEAIRLGCLIAPVQAFGDDGTDGGTTACAVVAAVRGGYSGDWDMFGPRGYPRCPAKWCFFRKAEITHLNDDHRWTREAIADWLEGLGL